MKSKVGQRSFSNFNELSSLEYDKSSLKGTLADSSALSHNVNNFYYGKAVIRNPENMVDLISDQYGRDFVTNLRQKNDQNKIMDKLTKFDHKVNRKIETAKFI